MNHIYLAVTLGIVAVHFVGLTLAAYRVFQHYALAKVAAPALVCLIAFFCEHFVGFGALSWLWPFTTALAGYLIVSERAVLRRHREIEAVFFAGLAYALLWRFAFPDIDSNSERLTNLHFIGSYFAGTTLPPIDSWFPPYRLDIYYSFQQYSAALLGRLFGLDVGTTFNVSVSIVIALTVTACAAVAQEFGVSNRWRYLVVAAFVLGGTGVSPISHWLMERAPDLWSSMRFAGEVADPAQFDAPLAAWIREIAYPPNPPATHIATKLPSETFSYLAYLGDFHAPLSGFLLLGLALMAMGRLDQEPHNKVATTVLVATVPAVIAANTWMFPLQALIVGAWLGFQHLQRRTPDWRTVVMAAAIGFLLIYPFLRGFALRALDFKTSVGWVMEVDRTPWLIALILHWPTVTLVLLGLLPHAERKLTWFFSVLWAGLLVMSECFYIDDIYSGEYNRFNTTLKWWPWIQTGALMTLGSLHLARGHRIAKFGTAAVLVLLLSYGYDLGRYWWVTPKTHFGRLEGAAWITEDGVQKALLDYLKVVERGIVLERVPATGFTYAPAMAMFSGQHAMLGWSGHESLWRGYRPDVNALYDQTNLFYQGKLPESATWLHMHDVRYVVWLKHDNIEPFDAHAAIQAQIGKDYAWKEFYGAENLKVGVWVRRDKN